MADVQENVIEWYTGDDVITLTVTQRKFASIVRRLVEEYRSRGDERATIFENEDGSLFCHLPLEVLRLHAKSKRSLSDEQRQAARERLAAAAAIRRVAKEAGEADV